MKAATAWASTAESLGKSEREAGPRVHQSGARRYALAMGHALELALTAAHAQWAHDVEGDILPMAAARRLSMRSPEFSIYSIGEARRLILEPGKPTP